MGRALPVALALLLCAGVAHADAITVPSLGVTFDAPYDPYLGDWELEDEETLVLVNEGGVLLRVFVWRLTQSCAAELGAHAVSSPTGFPSGWLGDGDHTGCVDIATGTALEASIDDRTDHGVAMLSALEAAMRGTNAAPAAPSTTSPPDEGQGGAASDESWGDDATATDPASDGTATDPTSSDASYGSDGGLGYAYGAELPPPSEPGPAAGSHRSLTALRVTAGLAQFHPGTGASANGLLVGLELPFHPVRRHLAVEGAASYRYASADTASAYDVHAGCLLSIANGWLAAAWAFGGGVDGWSQAIDLPAAPFAYTGPRLQIGSPRVALRLSTSAVFRKQTGEWRVGAGVATSAWTLPLAVDVEHTTLGQDRAFAITGGIGF